MAAEEVPQAWLDLIDSLEPHVSPDWTRAAREHGGQSWVRLVALVDAHHQLSSPRITEKIAMTMADLAENREAEQKGWEAIREKARDARMEIAARIVDSAAEVLPEPLLPLFVRSVEPTSIS